MENKLLTEIKDGYTRENTGQKWSDFSWTEGIGDLDVNEIATRYAAKVKSIKEWICIKDTHAVDLPGLYINVGEIIEGSLLDGFIITTYHKYNARDFREYSKENEGLIRDVRELREALELAAVYKSTLPSDWTKINNALSKTAHYNQNTDV